MYLPHAAATLTLHTPLCFCQKIQTDFVIHVGVSNPNPNRTEDVSA
jgi:hypothetical protein